MLPYRPELKQLARELRNNSTLSEVLLWQQLKNRQVKGYKFLRQKPIGAFIVDFFCPDLMLALEVDGVTHDRKIELDKVRQQRLEALGITVLRFQDIDVKKKMDGVLQMLQKWIDEIEDKHPPNPPEGGNHSSQSD